MPARNYYRGAYGDIKPITTHPSKALDHSGKIKPDYYETEVQAWAAILAHCADSVHHVERRGMELNKRMEVNVLDLVRRRAAQRSAEQAFREWKQRHPLSASA